MADLSGLPGPHHRRPGARHVRRAGLIAATLALTVAGCGTTDVTAQDERAQAEADFGAFAPGGDTSAWIVQAGLRDAPWFYRGIAAMRNDALSSPDGAYRVALAHAQRIAALDPPTGSTGQVGDVRAPIDAVRESAPIRAISSVENPQQAVQGLQAAMGSRQFLYGAPVLVSDAFDDAYSLARLQREGAVILGRTRYAGLEGGDSPRNPHLLSLYACGSGAAAAVAIAVASAAIEHGEATTCGAAAVGVVGFLPAHSRGEAGIIARSVADAALVSAALEGARTPVVAGEWEAMRIGVIRPNGASRQELALFDAQVAQLEQTGASVAVLDGRLDLQEAIEEYALTAIITPTSAALRPSGLAHLTAPMGFIDGLPAGMSILGDDIAVLQLGGLYDELAQARRAPTLARDVRELRAAGR